VQAELLTPLNHTEPPQKAKPGAVSRRKSDLSDLRMKKPISGKPEIGAHFANFN